MKINNGVGPHAFIRALGNVWKVFFVHENSNDALLAMTIGNLVADLWHSHRPQAHTNLEKAIAIHHDGDFIDDERLGVFANDNDRTISTDLAPRIVRRLEHAAN